MMRPLLLALSFVFATFLATATAQNYTAPEPSPLQETPPPPEATTSPPPPSPPPPAASPPPPSPPPQPQWTPVTDVNDLTIQQVGQFAVRMYALSTGLVQMSLLNVVSGETQPYNGGYYFHLVVVTVSGGRKAQYDASVWGIIGTMTWKLQSFTAH